MVEVSDAQLVTSVARFSDVALAEAYRRHRGAVYGLARRILGSVSEAEDVTQDVFLRLWNQPDWFDAGRGSLRSFLLAQAHARAVDLIRSLNAPAAPGSQRRAADGRRPTTTSATRYGASNWPKRSRGLCEHFPTTSGVPLSWPTSRDTPTSKSPSSWINPREQ